jgi:hypothetical protein
MEHNKQSYSLFSQNNRLHADLFFTAFMYHGLDIVNVLTIVVNFYKKVFPKRRHAAENPQR